MNTKIEMKSALIGLLLGVLGTAAIAATSSSGQTGRYQIAGTGNHGLIIDTATGQVWSGYFPSNEGKTDANFFQPKIGARK